jgi:membrane protease YdiL (CAAX protease family)
MATAENPARVELIASKQHTAGVLLLIVMFGVLGRVLVTDRPAAVLQGAHVHIYLGALATEWLLFLYVRFGVRRRGVRTVRQIIDESSWSVARWSLYAAIAVVAALVWMACGFVLGKVLDVSADEVRHLQSLLPKNALEKVCWVVLSVSTGFCEEFVYRGYLQQQFRRLTGSLSAAVVLQAIVFGVAHVSLPWQIAVSVMFLALLLGGVAAWRKSLIPVMLLHAGFDILAGVFSSP